ncbi:hypothetical protein LuPra_02248 [Luteitalea pratensis]|uniref:Uncharacterized protein n=1 Tax=Luteitalea pratensis TaxID=1855912 RepID=A0A143PMP8_LUTPR|nr:hypothetical protein [Luteitalea pratensis]AMY09039.1 hypothetical protein LuPra_02248 [Luteitalea pratensis]
MATFAHRVFAALGRFNGQLSSFRERVNTTPADASRLPAKILQQLREATERARTASDAITRSFVLIEQTGLDVVDMQVRLQGETARLASALATIGEAVARQHFVRESFGDLLVELDEAAQLVAAAVFPSAVQGLREVNVKLWDFEKLQWKRYTDLLTVVVQRRSITVDQQAHMQEIADDVARAFGEVNTLLNDLAESRPSDARALQARLDTAPVRLTDALGVARDRMSQVAGPFAAFAPIIEASADVAADVSALLCELTIPVFPVYEALGPCCDVITRTMYEGVSGVQAFALLNILARLQATRPSGRSMLEGRHVTVTHVFPDRIYLEADRSIITDVAADRAFQSAPAALHRFKEGSYKQTTFPKGNLQLSYASRPGDRVAIDADMDLYRSAVPHLFGEVLVNHLTGSSTSQFAVRRILDEQDIAAIGSFELLRA